MSAFHQDGKELDITFAADTEPGVLIQYAGVVCIVNSNPNTNDDGTGTWLAGSTGSCRRNCVVRVANSGVVFADGATVGYSVADDNAVVAAGGDFDCGTCVGGAGATDTVLVLI
jgi:hypothetical protein